MGKKTNDDWNLLNAKLTRLKNTIWVLQWESRSSHSPEAHRLSTFSTQTKYQASLSLGLEKTFFNK